MIKVFTLIYAGLFSVMTFGQTMPLDFENSNHRFTPFSGAWFELTNDPMNSANKVGEFNNSGANAWEGFTIDLQKAITLDSSQVLSLRFYAPDGNTHHVMLKLEQGTQPDIELGKGIGPNGGWNDSVLFDFANAVLSSDGSTPVNGTGSYSKLTVFIDGGNAIAGTFYLDNITDGSTTEPLTVDVEYPYLVWADEFDSPGMINTEKWHHQTKMILPGGWANNEEQHYTNRIDNSYVDPFGYLHIVAIKEPFSDQGVTKDYTSARLNSKFAFTYGRVDVRAKIPVKPGTWPAIWLLGKNINENGGYWDATHGTTPWPACGEIDIMEYGIFHSEDVNYIGSSLHTPCCHAGNPNHGGIVTQNIGADFHVYSMNWSPNEITFLLDSVPFYTYHPTIQDASTWPFFEDQYVLLNVAMGGFAGTIQNSFTSDEMVIDYVRVYGPEIPANTTALDVPTARIYPNPTKGSFEVQSTETVKSLTITNLQGKIVTQKTTVDKSVDISGLVPGVYFVTLQLPNQQVIEKLVVQ